MIDLNKEAEGYAAIPCTLALTASQKIQIAYMSGATNSKYVQAKIIQAQIDENTSILEMLKMHRNDRCIYVIRERIINLEQQLKQLEK
jgi:hypothetical protein